MIRGVAVYRGKRNGVVAGPQNNQRQTTKTVQWGITAKRKNSEQNKTEG